MICVREGGKAEGVYCLEVCGDTFELSPSKYLYIPQSVLYLYCAVPTDNYYQHRHWTEAVVESFQVQVGTFFHEILGKLLVYLMSEVCRQCAVLALTRLNLTPQTEGNVIF